VFQPFHLDSPCQGAEKIRNGLFTLQRMVGQSVCVAFDQLEDTFLAVDQPDRSEGARFSQQLSILLRNLSVMPGFCMLFTCQMSLWEGLVGRIPPMLFDRMTEGHRPQVLPPLDDGTARELVQQRMAALVWSRLVAGGPPMDQPCFPFQHGEVHQILLDSGGELRAFLQRAQQEFESQLSSPMSPRTQPRPRIHLACVEPREVMSHEATAVLIRGENLPADVRVLFGGQEIQTPHVCRPEAGEIDVTSPVGLVGDVEVRVEAVDEPGDGDCLILLFMERQVPRPYRQHIDSQRLKDRRLELKLSQKDVANRLLDSHPEISKLSRVKDWQPYVSRVENGTWRTAPDDLYVWLAELYGRPLSSFAKQHSSSNV
jgi:hypothetical protein